MACMHEQVADRFHETVVVASRVPCMAGEKKSDVSIVNSFFIPYW